MQPRRLRRLLGQVALERGGPVARALELLLQPARAGARLARPAPRVLLVRRGVVALGLQGGDAGLQVGFNAGPVLRGDEVLRLQRLDLAEQVRVRVGGAARRGLLGARPVEFEAGFERL